MDVLDSFNLAAFPKRELEGLLMRHFLELSYTTPGSIEETRIRCSIAQLRMALQPYEL